jgi:hypothetical protein
VAFFVRLESPTYDRTEIGLGITRRCDATGRRLPDVVENIINDAQCTCVRIAVKHFYNHKM